MYFVWPRPHALTAQDGPALLFRLLLPPVPAPGGRGQRPSETTGAARDGVRSPAAGCRRPAAPPRRGPGWRPRPPGGPDEERHHPGAVGQVDGVNDVGPGDVFLGQLADVSFR